MVHAGAEPGPDASIVLHRWRAVRRLLTAGDLGFARAWIDGDCSSPDLVALIRLAARNLNAMGRTTQGSLAFRLAFRLRHMMNANTRRGSARNIMAHYDMGNDFFKVWLDEKMLYSSALWDDATPTLEAAQVKKLERVTSLLEIHGGERVLEIGCGWGALAVRLAEAGAAQVTGVTISPSQLAFARSLAASRGWASKVALRLQDYRDVEGRFDRIVSIEMLEAVGERWWPTYFDRIARCLEPGGLAVLQAITIGDDHFEDYRRTVDFIQRYIFPGGCLPSRGALHRQLERAGLRLTGVETFGASYARTLAEWGAGSTAVGPKSPRRASMNNFAACGIITSAIARRVFWRGSLTSGSTVSNGSARGRERLLGGRCVTGSLAGAIGAIFLVGIGAADAASKPSYFGRWARGDGNARIVIRPCGGSVCAINTWIRPGTPREKTGDRLVMNVTSARPDQWKGQAFDPQRDLTYAVRINVANQRMTTRGCMLAGFICKRMTWTRIGSN